mmetsp:Transcript_46787/g.116607  ORF Transcript_46787/g.116607 Transcript_46787/m.116607 type:complete len:120 (+) Transcript_46787:235-594(+)
MAVFEALLLRERHYLLGLKDKTGRTPLHMVAGRGAVHLVGMFVELGGTDLLKARRNDGETPLHGAARHADVVIAMLRMNQDLLKLEDNRGHTPLCPRQPESCRDDVWLGWSCGHGAAPV